jgi:hypothetical protein
LNNTNKAQEETKEETQEDGSSSNEDLLSRREHLSDKKCMSGTNSPKIDESLS